MKKHDNKQVHDLPNIGDTLANELRQIEVFTAGDLKKMGSAAALYKIKGASGKHCINMLYALEGAIKGIRWHDLRKEEKEGAKKAFYKMLDE